MKTRANVSFHMKCRIIELRFGEIHSTIPRGKSISQISKIVSISRSTVHQTIKNYLNNDGNILHPEKHERTRIIKS
jgi:transposase